MIKNEAIVKFLHLHKPDIEKFFVARVKNGSTLTLDKFILIISKDKYNFVKESGMASSAASKLSKSLFPNKTTNMKLCSYLFGLYDHKSCCKCKLILPFNQFYKRNRSSTGYSEECKICTDSRLDFCIRDKEKLKTRKSEYKRNNRGKFNEWEARRRARKLQAIPKWADLEKIKEIYNNCPEGHEVDHYYPLMGALVCGLHVETNLQYLTLSDNRHKGNSMPTSGEINAT